MFHVCICVSISDRTLATVHEECCTICNGKEGHEIHHFTPPSQAMFDYDFDEDDYFSDNEYYIPADADPV